MIPIAVWLLVLGYGLTYVAYCNLKTPANGIAFSDALNPRLTGGPCKDGSCTKCSGAKTRVATAIQPGSSPMTGADASLLRNVAGTAPPPVGSVLSA